MKLLDTAYSAIPSNCPTHDQVLNVLKLRSKLKIQINNEEFIMEIIDFKVSAIGPELDRLKWDISLYETIKDKVNLCYEDEDATNNHEPFDLDSNGELGFDLVNFKSAPIYNNKEYGIQGTVAVREEEDVERTESSLIHLVLELSFSFPDIEFNIITDFVILSLKKGELLDFEDQILYLYDRNHQLQETRDLVEPEVVENNKVTIKRDCLESHITVSDINKKLVKPIYTRHIARKLEENIYLPLKYKVIYHNFYKIAAQCTKNEYQKNIKDISFFSDYYMEYIMQSANTYLIKNKKGKTIDRFAISKNGDITFDESVNLWRRYF